MTVEERLDRIEQKIDILLQLATADIGKAVFDAAGNFLGVQPYDPEGGDQ